MADERLQLSDCQDQSLDSLLQGSHLVKTMIDGGLLKANGTLELLNLALQDGVVIMISVNPHMCPFIVCGELVIVLYNCLLSSVHHSLELLLVRLVLAINLDHLRSESSPLLLRIIHL